MLTFAHATLLLLLAVAAAIAPLPHLGAPSQFDSAVVSTVKEKAQKFRSSQSSHSLLSQNYTQLSPQTAKLSSPSATLSPGSPKLQMAIPHQSGDSSVSHT